MNKKYFFFDIDGTLTDRTTGKIVPSAQEAIYKLKEAGHFVAIATGRAMYKAVGFQQEHGFDHMVCNGGNGIIIDNEVKENQPLPYEKIRPIYDEALSLGYGVLAAIDDSKKVYANSFDFIKQVGERKEPTTYIIDKDFEPKDVIYKIYISIPKEEENKLTLLDTVGHMRFEPEYLMYQPDDKKGGILRALEYVGGNPDDVVVFGDDTNDFAMFDERFYCVAMGNGNEELKKKADYVAPKNTDDGIYKTCEEHGWF